VRERHCIVGLPLKWALATHSVIPKLPDADVSGFLQIEAERGFPTDVTMLQVASSRLASSLGEGHVTFVGIPRNHVERLQQVLRAAKLKPISFSLGVVALQPARTDDADGVLALVVGDNYVGLQITCGGGVAALRALEGAVEEGGGRKLHSDLIAREARITMGQLPADLRDSVKRVRIFGPREQVQTLADEIRQRFESGGLRVEIVSVYPPNEFGRTIPADTAVSEAFSLAARQLVGRDDPFEFLPPRISGWQRVTTKYAPGKLRKAAAVAAAVVAIVIALFGIQQWRLTQLRSEWKGMSTKVQDLEGVSERINQYRPWFDTSFRCLNILKGLTTAFPEDGSLTAKTVEIRDMNTVSCSGNAENYSVLARTIHQLNTVNGFTNVNYQVRGKAPTQFTLDFRVENGRL
jgi:hypothetical protein